jgi:hypothetical protein
MSLECHATSVKVSFQSGESMQPDGLKVNESKPFKAHA